MEPGSLERNLKAASGTLLAAAGPETIVVWGGAGAGGGGNCGGGKGVLDAVVAVQLTVMLEQPS